MVVAFIWRRHARSDTAARVRSESEFEALSNDTATDIDAIGF
jgi:hypothetical protein